MKRIAVAGTESRVGFLVSNAKDDSKKFVTGRQLCAVKSLPVIIPLFVKRSFTKILKSIILYQVIVLWQSAE